MSIREKLAELATRAYNDAQQCSADLRLELRQLDMRKAEVEAQLRAAELSQQRIASFQAHGNGGFQCSWCWVGSGVSSILELVPAPPSVELYRCGTCGSEYAAPTTPERLTA